MSLQLDRRTTVTLLLTPVVLGVLAAAGGLLHASREPSILLGIGTAAWVAFHMALRKQPREAVTCGVGAWTLYVACYAGVNSLLAPLGMVPVWVPHGAYLLGGTAIAILAAMFGGMAGIGWRARHTSELEDTHM